MKKNGGESTAKLSRRSFLGQAAVAAAAAPMAIRAQATNNTPAAAPARLTPGGSGPIKVLFLTGYHPFDRENLFLALDSMGQEITWTHVEHPAAEVFYDPKAAELFDVFLFYDAYMGRKPGAPPPYTYAPPTAEMQEGLKKLTQSGEKGFVFLHHAIAAWVHSWPAGVNGSNAYVEMTGAAADWGTPLKNIRGKDYPVSGFRQGTEQHLTVVDKQHPVTAGLGDGFDVVDEVYLCPMFEDSVHCLIRTSFEPTEDKFSHGPSGVHVGAGHPPGSNMTAWVKTAEQSPVAYIQLGHDNGTWSNKNWRRLVLNAIQWAASPEAKTWAKANPKRIFV
jgi:type 1 glutamine amidotransferase